MNKSEKEEREFRAAFNEELVKLAEDISEHNSSLLKLLLSIQENDDKTKFNGALRLEIEMPDNASEKQVSKTIKELTLRVDLAHRAFGGHGFQIRSAEIEHPQHSLEPQHA